MIDKDKLERFIVERLEDTEYFLVDVSVSADNRIVVEIDGVQGVDIDACADLTRAVEAEFDRDEEDYELEIGSAGLTSPFKVKAQYVKNLGNDVEVLTAEGKKLRGKLSDAGENEFTIVVEEKVKREGEKRPSLEEVRYTFPYSDVKYTKYLLQF